MAEQTITEEFNDYLVDEYGAEAAAVMMSHFDKLTVTRLAQMLRLEKALHVAEVDDSVLEKFYALKDSVGAY